MIKDVQLEVKKIVANAQAYFAKAGTKGAVVGNSGGKDSAVVIGLLAMALGKENVIAVKLPCETEPGEMADADLVAETFGVTSKTVNIEEAYSKMVKAIEEATGMPVSEEALVNVKPRIRMTTLYAIAQTNHYLVAGTGNKCEYEVGYFTKFGDGGYDYNPIGEYTVEEVYQIARAIGVPEKILVKPPKDGLGTLTDEEKLGVTYDQIAEYLETGTTTPKEACDKIKKLIASSEHKKRMPYKYMRVHKKV